MAGIRLHHPTLRSADGSTVTYVVEIPQPYPRAYNCPNCKRQHSNKAIHLRLDGNGDVIVSPEVFLKLKEVFFAGFEVSNEVKKPPRLAVGAVARDKERVIDAPLNPDLKHGDQIMDSVTRWQASAKIEEVFKPILEHKQLLHDKKLHKKLRLKRRIFT